ncbi:MAG: hypothetical protein ABIP79_08225, partial [Chitinophagaceae bacterium]
QKSKRQNTIALVTGISGTLLCTIGGIMYLSEFEDGLSGGTGYNETNAKNGNALMIAGGGLLLISFPFRVAARKNKRLAIAIKNDPLHALQKNGFRINHVPSLAFKINL